MVNSRTKTILIFWYLIIGIFIITLAIYRNPKIIEVVIPLTFEKNAPHGLINTTSKKLSKLKKMIAESLKS